MVAVVGGWKGEGWNATSPRLAQRPLGLADPGHASAWGALRAHDLGRRPARYDGSGEVCRAGDLFAQIPQVVRHLGNVLKELEGELSDLVKLLCFYVNDGSRRRARSWRRWPPPCRPRPSPPSPRYRFPISPIPGSPSRWRAMPCGGRMTPGCPRSLRPHTGLSPLPDRFAPALRCGKMIYVSAQSPVDASGGCSIPATSSPRPGR